MNLCQFVKEKRRSLKWTQIDLAEKAGVGLRFVRSLAQGNAFPVSLTLPLKVRIV